MKGRLMISPVCLYVHPLITLEPISRCLWNSAGGHTIEGGLDTLIFNPIPLTVLKWRRFKLLRWVQNLHHAALNYQGLSGKHVIQTIAVWQLRPYLCNNNPKIICHCMQYETLTLTGHGLNITLTVQYLAAIKKRCMTKGECIRTSLIILSC
jgi:hypothetical protein